MAISSVHKSTILGLISLCLVENVLGRGQNLPVSFSQKTYGFDGPWHAVTIGVGGWDPLDSNNEENDHPFAAPEDQTQIDLYPGGSFTTRVITSAACNDFSAYGECAAGGTWKPPSRTNIQFAPNNNDKDTGLMETTKIFRNALTYAKNTVFNASIGVVTTGNITNPDGTTRGVELGNFALGAEDQAQVFTLSEDGSIPPIQAWTYSGYLYNTSQIPSYSYGLHIGSVAFNYPGSLVFGGYDKGRMIGQTSSFDGEVQLLDIKFGVETGASPLPFNSKDQLLITNTSQPGQIQVSPDPLSPYMYLPKQTCDAITNGLPISFDDKSKYYLWNTNDPNFQKLVTSPAYLAFQFPPSPGQTDNVVIKVPFALLNLTLTPPIVSTPVQYFPCMPDNPQSGTYTLGRSFLQSAFLGRNWNRKTTWLAQAPGPGVAKQGLGVQYTDLQDTDTTINGFLGNDLFAKSWAGQWQPIKAPGSGSGGKSNGGSSDNNNNNSSSGGLSAGAKGGIGAGVGCAVVALLAGAAFLFRRQRQKHRDSPTTQSLFSGSGRQSDAGTMQRWQNENKDPHVWNHQSTNYTPYDPYVHGPAPAPPPSEPAEADSLPTSGPVYEMPAPERRP